MSAGTIPARAAAARSSRSAACTECPSQPSSPRRRGPYRRHTANPPVPSELSGHQVGGLATWLIAVETNRAVAQGGAVRPKKLDLLVAHRTAHQRHGGNARAHAAVEPDRAEENFDHHQRAAVLDPVQVEQLGLLVKSGRKKVLTLILRDGRIVTDPAAGIGDQL